MVDQMKIGILTYHRSHNYGALLQAIALRKVLTEMGHQVTYIDYWPAYHRHMYALFSFSKMNDQATIKSKYRYCKNCILYYSIRKKRIESFESFIKRYISPFTSSLKDNYDIIVHGSDQIWRIQYEIHKYNPFYFGSHNISAKKKISYAASMGSLPNNEKDKQQLRKLVSNLDDISVREKDLKGMLMNMGYTQISHDLDPTMLLTSVQWKEIINCSISPSDKYAVFYQIKNSFDIAQLKNVCKDSGLKLITICSNANGYETDSVIRTANPMSFLSLIAGAEFVFTSSFHGLVFSLLFHKPFYASFSSNTERAESLLSLLSLSDRLLKPFVQISELDKNINYCNVDSIIKELKEKSVAYLKNSLLI